MKPDWVVALEELEAFVRERGWRVTDYGHAGLIRALIAEHQAALDPTALAEAMHWDRHHAGTNPEHEQAPHPHPVDTAVAERILAVYERIAGQSE